MSPWHYPSRQRTVGFVLYLALLGLVSLALAQDPPELTAYLFQTGSISPADAWKVEFRPGDDPDEKKAIPTVKNLPKGSYSLSIYAIGDLKTTNSWPPTQAEAEFEIGESDDPKALPAIQLSQAFAKSLVGHGVKIERKSPAPTVAVFGVIGVSKAGWNEKLTGTKVASCELQPIANAAALGVSGRVEFEETDGGELKVVAKVTGLPGNLGYGFHIHELGDLGSMDGMSTKGHYNPKGVAHGLPGGSEAVHVGDLGNIGFYDNAGVGWYHESALKGIRIGSSSGTENILGRAVVVHSQMDNGCEQPTGGAGARLAFCVIGIATTKSLPVPPFDIPPQLGSTGCSLANTPEKSTRSAAFIWMTVLISIALACIGILFAYNWWRAKNNPTTSTASGRQPWYAQQDEEDADTADGLSSP